MKDEILIDAIEKQIKRIREEECGDQQPSEIIYNDGQIFALIG